MAAGGGAAGGAPAGGAPAGGAAAGSGASDDGVTDVSAGTACGSADAAGGYDTYTNKTETKTKHKT